MLVTPEILRADKKICGMLWPFDFEVRDPDHGAIWFDTAPLQPFEVVAANDCFRHSPGPFRAP